MDAKTWNALDEHEQEVELHEAYRVAHMLAAGLDGPDDGPLTREQIVHALVVLHLEDERKAALEAGDGDVRARDF